VCFSASGGRLLGKPAFLSELQKRAEKRQLELIQGQGQWPWPLSFQLDLAEIKAGFWPSRDGQKRSVLGRGDIVKNGPTRGSSSLSRAAARESPPSPLLRRALHRANAQGRRGSRDGGLYGLRAIKTGGAADRPVLRYVHPGMYHLCTPPAHTPPYMHPGYTHVHPP